MAKAATMGVAKAAPGGVAAAVFVALFAYTYRGWTDVTVDFGRELYVAWRIASGDVLYRDIAWPSGPLSAHVNALVFRVYGVSLTALALWNTALAALTFGLVYALVARYTTRWTAALVTSVASVIFAFGQHGGIGNYNHVTPYSHEAVHGTLAGALALVALHGAVRRASLPLVVLAGLALAASFATKAEPFVAAVTGMAAFIVFQPIDVRLRLAVRALSGFMAGFALALALLTQQMPLREALVGLLGAWPYILNGTVTEAHFYARLAGLDRPAAELRTTLNWTAAWFCALTPVLLALRMIGPRLRGAAMSVALFVLALVIGLAALEIEDVLDIGRPTALCILALISAQSYNVLRAQPGSRPKLVERLSWSAFALALLLKLGLKQTWIFYGFVHGLPAFAIIAAALIHGSNRYISNRYSAAGHDSSAPGALASSERGALGQWWIAGLLVALAIVHVRSMSLWRSYKVHEVGTSADGILADGRGDEVAQALDWLAANTAPEATVLVLPEGLSLNYWARRRSPLRFVGFMPTELQLFGEDSIVRALELSAPDVVILVHKDTSDYGVQYFGRDYGRALGAWIGARYEPVALFGSEPFTDWRFGVALLRPR